MKKRLQHCSKCGEETWHMVGKKQATKKAGPYTRRTTSECTTCGIKEIVGRLNKRRVISRHNERPKD